MWLECFYLPCDSCVLQPNEDPWWEVRAHCPGHAPKLTVDTLQLQQEVDQKSHATLPLLPGEEALSAAAEGLSHLNSLTWVKTLGGGFAGAVALLLIILILFCLVLVWTTSPPTGHKWGHCQVCFSYYKRGRCCLTLAEPSIPLRHSHDITRKSQLRHDGPMSVIPP